MYKFRAASEMLSASITATSVALELQGVKFRGEEAPWLLVALGAFVTFVVLVYVRVYLLHRELHALERRVHIRAYGRPRAGLGRDWRHVDVDSANHRYRSVTPSVSVLLSSDAEQEYLLSDLYIEMYRKWSWGRLIGRSTIYRLEPETIGRRQVRNPKTASRVNWLVKPEAPQQHMVVDFGEHWASGDGPKWMNRTVAYRLVAEFGSKRRVRVPILDPTGDPLPEPTGGSGVEQFDAVIEHLGLLRGEVRGARKELNSAINKVTAAELAERWNVTLAEDCLEKALAIATFGVGVAAYIGQESLLGTGIRERWQAIDIPDGLKDYGSEMLVVADQQAELLRTVIEELDVELRASPR